MIPAVLMYKSIMNFHNNHAPPYTHTPKVRQERLIFSITVSSAGVGSWSSLKHTGLPKPDSRSSKSWRVTFAQFLSHATGNKI